MDARAATGRVTWARGGWLPAIEDVLSEWDFDLPDDRIARQPAPERDGSRLLVSRADGLDDRRFFELPGLLAPGDLLVANDTRVMAARLFAHRDTGGSVEIFLLQPGPGPVDCLVRPARRLRDGERLALDGGGAVVLRGAGNRWKAELDRSATEVMAEQGHVPLPPYLGRPDVPEDRERYQTVYAGPLGSCAAPTAGLHFTPAVLDALRSRGIGWATVTLHVGIGTFRPVDADDLATGRLHAEPYAIPEATADAIAATRAAGGRIIAVGTTSCRTLESWAASGEPVGETRLFIRPGYRFRVVDGLVTNFHLPRSSLLMLVAALIGRDRLFSAYEHALTHDYRFFSYGDAMLVL